MTKIYKLLEEKNYWYGKYLACTEAFLAALRHAPEIALDELELFYGNRESLLRILEGLDGKIEDELKLVERSGGEPGSEQTTKIRYFLREKDSIIERIVDLDKQLITGIEELRTRSGEQLKNLAKGKKALAKYKSGASGSERLDKRV